MMAFERKGFKFPPGGYFTPTDNELIEFYLKPKVLKEDLVFDVVKEIPVYGPGCNPWEIFPVSGDSWFACPGKPTEKVMFVFTNLSLISETKSGVNTSKKAGFGTWGGQTGKTRIMDSYGKKVIGERKYLVFEVNEIDSGAGAHQFGYYSMHEFSLSGVYGGFDLSRNLVLCKIRYDSSKKASFVQLAPKRVLKNCNKPLKKQQNSCKPLEKQQDSNKHVEEGSSVDKLVEGSSVDTLVDRSVSDCLVGGQDVINDLFNDDDPGVVFSVDDDWVQEFMNSLEEALVQDNTIPNLGKRKLEAESAVGTKKLCLG